MLKNFNIILNDNRGNDRVFYSIYEFIKWIRDNYNEYELFCKLNENNDFFIDYKFIYSIKIDADYEEFHYYSFIIKQIIMNELERMHFLKRQENED